MSAYWIARCHVKDSNQFTKYVKLAGPIIEAQGGKFLVRGGRQVEVEGGSFERTVLVKFGTFNEAVRCYDSNDYKKALEFVKISAERHVVIVEGLDN